MKKIRVRSPLPSFGAALAICGLQFLSALFPCASAQANPTNFFDWENLQSDVPGVADRADSNLVNSWGLALNTSANIFWVADNGTGLSTLYKPDGTPVPLIVTIPPTSGDTGTPPAAAPTGIVFNISNNAFVLPNGHPAAFIFDGEDGRITAWNGGTDAVIVRDNSSSGAVYKGLALVVRQNGEPTLYATNFNSGNVDVFDKNFVPETLAGNFKDPNPPGVPAGAVGWAPFNIAGIDGNIYVTFAAQNAEKHDDVANLGNGFVDVFTKEGFFVKHLITGGLLDSPWGLARVPDHFGRFDSLLDSPRFTSVPDHFGIFDHNALLVGNFGNGQINAYDVHSGAPIATLFRRAGQPLDFNGLWALVFFKDRLYFTAGIVDEAHGLFGFIHRSNNDNDSDK